MRSVPHWVFASAFVALVGAHAAAQEPPGFTAYLDDVAADAAAAGLSPATVSTALASVRFQDRAVELDRDQPEFVRTFWDSLDAAVGGSRVADGRARLARHGALLAEVEGRYGVPAHMLVAFWGIESDFGRFTGDFPVIDVTATLAFDGRREAFFRSELLDALRLLDRGTVQLPLLGSWAGAMGQTQFLPSTLLQHGVDHDGDGRIDPWGSLADVFASSANYLQSLGWRDGERWGREVRVPADFDWTQAELTVLKPLADWQRLGIRRLDGGDLPAVEGMAASLILPMGHRGPAFLVYDNFRVILEWNTSLHYALAIGHLADRIAGAGPLAGPRPDLGRALNYAEAEELQRLLLAMGHDPGDIDGFVGPNTRDAVRGFQRDIGAPADGYPTLDLLAQLRVAAGR